MAINLKASSLAVACVVLASSLRSINAAGQAPLSSVPGVTPAHTRNSEPAKRKSPPPARLRRAPAAASPANHGGSHPPRAAARIARKGDMIASLQERLERQEKLLALQQQQITKLVATLDELMNSVKGAREVSSGSAPEHQSLQVATPDADLALVRTSRRGGQIHRQRRPLAARLLPQPLRESPTAHLPTPCWFLLPPPAWFPRLIRISHRLSPPRRPGSNPTLHHKIRYPQQAGGRNLQGGCGFQVQWRFSTARRWDFPVLERCSGPRAGCSGALPGSAEL